MTDPYANLRAAQAAGKRIEFNAGDGWGYLAAPNFFQPPECYRIAPGQDAPLFEAGKCYRQRNGTVLRVTNLKGASSTYPMIAVFADSDRAGGYLLTATGRYNHAGQESQFDLLPGAVPGPREDQKYAPQTALALMDAIMQKPNICPHCGKDTNKPPEPVVNFAGVRHDGTMTCSQRNTNGLLQMAAIIRIACDPRTGKVLSVTTEKP